MVVLSGPTDSFGSSFGRHGRSFFANRAGVKYANSYCPVKPIFAVPDIHPLQPDRRLETLTKDAGDGKSAPVVFPSSQSSLTQV